jgi:acyl-CoA thioesterase-2
VAAIQNGAQILNLAASFQVAEEGRSHQTPMPPAPPPQTVADDWMSAPAPDSEAGRRMSEFARTRPVEMRQIDPQDFQNPRVMAPHKAVWVRARDQLGAEVRRQHAALAFASDMNLLETAMRPHGAIWQTPGLQSASLDHAVWFHQSFDFSDWHLFVQESPITHSARGFVRGQIFSRDGRLVASVAQEGLLRFREPV